MHAARLYAGQQGSTSTLHFKRKSLKVSFPSNILTVSPLRFVLLRTSCGVR